MPRPMLRAAVLAALAAAPALAAAGGPPFGPAARPWVTGCDGGCDPTAAGRDEDGRGPGTLFSWGGRAEPGAGGPDLDAPLVTDRPDFTEAASTVGAGVAQVEFGYTFSADDANDGSGRTRTHSIGEPLLRLGVGADWLELRLAANYAAETTGVGGGPGVARDTADGGEDLYLGAKIALTPQAEWLPETAIIPQMTVPTGADAFTSDEVLPGANLVYAWELTENLATGGSTQVNRVVSGLAPVPVPGLGVNEADEGTFAELAQSWTVAASLTDRVGAYGEYFAFFPLDADEPDEHFLNGGLTYLLTDDVQYDVRAGFGLNDDAEDFFAGTGLSIRFR